MVVGPFLACILYHWIRSPYSAVKINGYSKSRLPDDDWVNVLENERGSEIDHSGIAKGVEVKRYRTRLLEDVQRDGRSTRYRGFERLLHIAFEWWLS